MLFGLGINPLAKHSSKATLWWKAVERQSQVVLFTVMAITARADLTTTIEKRGK